MFLTCPKSFANTVKKAESDVNTMEDRQEGSAEGLWGTEGGERGSEMGMDGSEVAGRV